MIYDSLDVESIQKDFPVTRKIVYMNNGSLAPLPLSSIKAMTDFLIRYSEVGPDSSTIQEYIVSLMNELRIRISHLINSEPEEIVFTQSTTEGLNFVSTGLNWKKSDMIVVRGGPHEHYANYFPWLNVSKKFEVKIKELKIDNNGFFDLDELEKLAKSSNIKLITLSHALYNNGAILPVEEVGKIAQDNNMLYCIDAAQSVGSIPIDVKRINCDFMAFPSFKWICGPPGIGIFYCKKKSADFLEPRYIGNESAIMTEKKDLVFLEPPVKFQTGFRNYVGLAGVEASSRYILRLGINTVRKMNITIANELRNELRKLPNIQIFGPDDEKLRTSIVSFVIDGVESKTIVSKLEENEIIVAVRDIHIDKKIIKTVRLSPHFFNSYDEISKLVKQLKIILK
jgi:cysteine desulfurase/selenocysteine lyase